MRHIYIILGIVLLSNLSFGQNPHNTDKQNKMRTVLCMDVIQTSNYTYLQVNEKDSLIWIAIPKMEAEKDKVYYFVGGMEMGPFNSKELDRTFDQLLFLAGVSSTPKPNNQEKKTHKAEVKTNKQDIEIEPTKGCITIEELYANKDEYADKVVSIKGQVTKFSDSIMNRNWIHVQDGTNHENDFDLTITSNEIVKIGDVIVISGKLTLNKDFGYGYFYKVLIEDGKIIK
ncbi:MAG: hypothetical protein PF485_02320 [Bacteroidales bacterium]|jgi:hypothetical protein|nr:hypothetical protein [Bacteroidales bacterium]